MLFYRFSVVPLLFLTFETKIAYILACLAFTLAGFLNPATVCVLVSFDSIFSQTGILYFLEF